MRRKIVLAMVLCLVVAALGIGAAPALAADGCTCHTAVPPTGGAPAAHEPLVLSVTDCTTCHKGMSPHPDPASLGRPSLSLECWGATLAGVLPGIGGRTVYLQQRLWGASDFTDITQVTTSGKLMWLGAYSYTAPSPTPWVAYRAVAEGGVSWWPVVKNNMPAMAGWLPLPGLTLKLGGVHIRTFKGSARPLMLAGESVDLTVQKLRAATHRWVKVKAKSAVISATGTYSWRIRSFAAGSYRIRASIAETANHVPRTTKWRYFKV